MPCYHPLQGYRSRTLNPSGKRSIVFSVDQGYRDMPMDVPCGQCIGCRLERSRQWAMRCVHEASLYEDNCFITLTYSPEFLPKDGSLDKSHFQKFMKRLRKEYGEGIRFFHCGEYGEDFGRPHYHACIFNFRFPDLVEMSNPRGDKYYVSESLNKLWGFGFCIVGDVTFESAAYVARYVTKKVTGKKALYHYNSINLITGEILAERRPEYVTMSRRPGIGRGWYEKFSSDCFPSDFIILRGKKMVPPKYYGNLFEIAYPGDMEKVKAKRIRAGFLNADNNTFDRLLVREVIQTKKFNLLKRSYESED